MARKIHKLFLNTLRDKHKMPIYTKLRLLLEQRYEAYNASLVESFFILNILHWK